MKPPDYIETVASKITDHGLRCRLREELADHWEDYCEHQDMTDTPKRVLGNETLLAHQTNAVASPGTFGNDAAVSVVCGAFTIVLFLVLSSFLTLDLESGSAAAKPFTVAASIIGIAFWGGVAWYVYLALQRRFVIRYGQSIRRMILLTIAVVAPCAILGIESLLSSINAFVADAPYSVTWQLVSSVLALTILCGVFLLAGRMVSSEIADADRILTQLRRRVPSLVAVVVAAGATLLVVTNDASGGGYDPLALVGAPFTLPLLILYLLWGLATNAIGFLFHAIGIPVIFAYWATVLSALLVGVVMPFVRLVLRKPISLVLQFASSIVIPLAIILPMVPHDIPTIIWDTPIVWSWDTLERKQLNVAYPWAATLMRRNDGINVGYSAYLIDGKVTVVQGGGSSYIVTRQETTRIRTTPEIQNLMHAANSGIYAEIPLGFTCDAKPIEDFFDTHEGSTSGLGMFGIQCANLAYKGTQIGTIGHGSLIDLDVSDDGLLAVSINMGSYDPTYVYIVDISEK